MLFSQGNELRGNNVSGVLCIKKSVPGMARTLYGNYERHMDVYYRPYQGEILNFKGQAKFGQIPSRKHLPHTIYMLLLKNQQKNEASSYQYFSVTVTNILELQSRKKSSERK